MPTATVTEPEITTARARRPVRDTQLVKAVDLARDWAGELASDFAPEGSDRGVGDWLRAITEDDRVVTHRFASTLPGYVGWEWSVTLARASRSKVVTVCDTALVAGADALLAPPWVPWSERIEPGDLGVGDLLVTAADDERLVPGFADPDADAAGDPAASSAVIDGPAGLGRPRVLSAIGRDLAASRWHAGDGGPNAPIARAAQFTCATCGFLVPLNGALAAMFGVCANEWSPSDGHVVTYDHGCGAHSETPAEATSLRPVETVVDELRYDPFLDDDRDM
jgi:hypothetical protein